MKEFLKTKSGRVVFGVLCVCFSTWCVHGFVQQVRTAHTHYVEQDFIAAMHQLQQSPPGMARVDTFLKQLRAIDTHYAPAEVQQGLHDYISALQQSMDAVKSGGDDKRLDDEVAASKDRLIAACKKYE